MALAPPLKPHDEIRIGSRRAIVCGSLAPEEIEVVYLDDRDRAINEPAVWRDDQWRFKHSGPTGGCADNYDRLQSFVSQLRQRR